MPNPPVYRKRIGCHVIDYLVAGVIIQDGEPGDGVPRGSVVSVGVRDRLRVAIAVEAGRCPQLNIRLVVDSERAAIYPGTLLVPPAPPALPPRGRGGGRRR